MESRERVISIVLSEQEWQAFVQTHPQPVEWIRAKILQEAGASPKSAAPIAGSFASAPAAASTTSATIR
jgi:hypothetical protein